VPRELTIIVQTTLDPAALAGPVRRAMGEVDGKIPVVRMQSVQSTVERATLRMRLVTALLVAAALAALFLGAVGLWGVVAYTLERRAPELAIRLAVGANVQQMLHTALGSAVSITAAGLAGGAAAAYVVTRGMEALLFEAQPMDVAGSVAVAVLLATVALAACIAPARRALRIDPARLLRSD
jgi:ABC-type antimicrobial peptide transport system permease subunit